MPSAPSATRTIQPAESGFSAAANEPRWTAVAAVAALIVVVALAYGNSLTGAFTYDDKPSIIYNGTTRHLWPPGDMLHPPGDGATVSGRPVLNATFAVNYAFSALDVRGYHLTNVLIHALAALTLFGLIRRTLRRPPLAQRYAGIATGAALAVAALWAAHPLHTEAVSYLAQRAESLMSLFYLLTLYGFLRSVDSPRANVWQGLAWVACLFGMGSKENMVSAPLAVLLFDRAFIAEGFAAAWRARRWFYVALLATWIPLGILVLSTGGNRGGSAGFDVGVSWAHYWLTQFPALFRYALLSLWPHPLVFDYGAISPPALETILTALLVIAAVGGTLYAVWRSPRVGFLAVIPFAILAPTSIVPGTTQMIVEHRMYLPLAALLALAIPLAGSRWRRGLGLAVPLVTLAFVAITAARNRLYRTEVSLWADTVAKRPENVVARGSLGAAYADMHRWPEALAQYRTALELNPNHGPTLANLGIALTQMGHPAEALPLLEKAVKLDKNNANAPLNLGVTLDLMKGPAEALPFYAEAVRLNPLLADAQNDYGDALCRTDHLDAGIPHLLEAIRLQPTYPEPHYNLAAGLARQGKLADARAEFALGARLRPGDASAYVTWGNFLQHIGHPAEALEAYGAAVQARPDSAEAHYSYGTALATARRYEEAIQQFTTAVKLRPDYAEAENNLANTYLALDRLDDAILHYRAALIIRPNNATTHNNLGLALARAGHLRQAAAEFSAAVQIDPDFTNARNNLQRAQAQLQDEGP